MRLLLFIVITVALGGPDSVPAALALSFVLKRAPGTARLLSSVPGILGLG